jgi:hypothetical protein
MDIQTVEWEGMDGFDLAEDRERWRAVVSVGMNPGFHKIGVIL